MKVRAVIFDLDGVISDTATIHAAAWKNTFDKVVSQAKYNKEPFSVCTDYKKYVDGKTRIEGVKCFLESRSIYLEMGSPEEESVCSINGLANLKNRKYRDLLLSDGVKIFEDAKDLVLQLYNNKMPLAVASSSKNAKLILKNTGLEKFFNVIMDGKTAQEKSINSKPHPDFYTYTASLLGIDVGRCVVVEDAISGVISAKKSGIGVVLGISRDGSPGALVESGADFVVQLLSDIPVDTILSGNFSGLNDKKYFEMEKSSEK